MIRIIALPKKLESASTLLIPHLHDGNLCLATALLRSLLLETLAFRNSDASRLFNESSTMKYLSHQLSFRLAKVERLYRRSLLAISKFCNYYCSYLASNFRSWNTIYFILYLSVRLLNLSVQIFEKKITRIN